jgi:LPXTG-site transpeptidase (sortase) family protein
MIGKRLTALLEVALWALSLGALVAFFGARQVDAAAARKAVADFRVAAAKDSAQLKTPMPDQATWSPGRLADFDYDAARNEAEALLHIPKLRLVAPVRKGTDDVTLDTFVGRVAYGARYGEGGNLVLAGHRDSYFRQLGELVERDVIEVQTRTGTWHYAVTAMWIVEPDDIEVVQETTRPSLTLITCYPFYFLGPAPQRYVVRAELIEDAN